jgi:hypothetical protein
MPDRRSQRAGGGAPDGATGRTGDSGDTVSRGTDPAPEPPLAAERARRGALHDELEAASAGRQWRRALDALGQLVAGEPVAARRARFHVAAAAIARDELGDAQLAIDQLGDALDADPRTAGGFDALDALWAARGDAAGRARAHRRQIERLGDAAPAGERAALWAGLAALCRDELADPDAAIAAYHVAVELVPGDAGRREQLAELYLAGGEPGRRGAIAELQQLLAAAPERIELYKALAELYLADGDLDRAWCVAQVLVLLGAASDGERQLFHRLRPARFVPVARRLTDELWARSISHPREDRRLGAIFAAALPAIATDTAQPLAAFGLAAAGRADLEREPRTIARILRGAASALAIEPPGVWLDGGAEGLRIANALDERGRSAPVVIVGMPELASTAERELAFAAGKHLAYLRPERFAALAIATAPGLEAALAQLIDPTARDLASPGGRGALADQLPDAVVERIAELAAGLGWRAGDGSVAAWRAATDLTANRAGFVLAGDLETAARAIATEGATLAGMTARDRLRDLLGYAASERYFTVRRHLGQRAGGET